jgi:hypothetical protein
VPVISKTYQPWKNPENTLDVLLLDVFGCVCSHFLEQTTARPNIHYTFEQAISDSYIGIQQAIERDRLAPTIMPKDGKNHYHKCKNCEEKFLISGFDTNPSLTMIQDTGPVYMNDDQANHVCANTADVMLWREFELECPHCRHIDSVKIRKAAFSSIVFNYIRGNIQTGIRNNAGKKPPQAKHQGPDGYRGAYGETGRRGVVISIDGSDGPDAIANSLESKREHQGISEETSKKIESVLTANLTPKHHEILALIFGFEYDGRKLDAMTQTECANFLGISKQRVCNVYNKALAKLRPHFDIDDEPDY